MQLRNLNTGSKNKMWSLRQNIAKKKEILKQICVLKAEYAHMASLRAMVRAIFDFKAICLLLKVGYSQGKKNFSVRNSKYALDRRVVSWVLPLAVFYNRAWGMLNVGSPKSSTMAGGGGLIQVIYPVPSRQGSKL